MVFTSGEHPGASPQVAGRRRRDGSLAVPEVPLRLRARLEPLLLPGSEPGPGPRAPLRAEADMPRPSLLQRIYICLSSVDEFFWGAEHWATERKMLSICGSFRDEFGEPRVSETRDYKACRARMQTTGRWR